MLSRIEYSVVVPVPSADAFQAFCNLERLLHRGIYESASWIEGKPWQVGSRVRYVVLTPLAAEILAVVTSYRPPHSIGLLNHAVGITAEQNVTFNKTVGGTRVLVVVEFVGKSRQVPDEVVEEAIKFYTHDALDTLAALYKGDGAASPSAT